MSNYGVLRDTKSGLYIQLTPSNSKFVPRMKATPVKAYDVAEDGALFQLLDRHNLDWHAPNIKFELLEV